eukprot:scaffold33812_cov199-Amphora_coffeaeformis.AAC.1
MKFLRRNPHLSSSSISATLSKHGRKGLRWQGSFSTVSTHSDHDSASAAAAAAAAADGALHRHVRFDESCNVVYDNTIASTSPDVIDMVIEELWLGRQDISDFRQEHYRTLDATKIMESMTPNSWTYALQVAYEKLCKSSKKRGSSKNESKLIPPSNPKTTLPDNAVGMDKWCITGYQKDKFARRQSLWKTVQTLQQQATKKQGTVNAQVLADACR